MRRPRLAAAPVDDHRHGVAGVVHEHLVAAQVGLAHGHRQARLPATVELAEADVAIAVRLGVDVLVPQDLQGDVLALQLPVQDRPIRLGHTAMALLLAARAVQTRLQIGVRQPRRQGPAQARALEPLRHLAQGRTGDPGPFGHLLDRQHRVQTQSQNLAHPAHGNPLRRDRSLQKGKTLASKKRPAMPAHGGIVSERVAASNRNGWRDHLGIRTQVSAE